MRYKTKPVPFNTLLGTTFYSLYQVLMAAVIVLVFFTNLPVWIDSQTGLITAPNVYLAFLLAPLPYVFRDRLTVFQFARHPYIWWCALVMLMHLSGFIRAEHFGGTIEEAAIQVDRMQKFLIAPAAAYLVYSISHSTFRPFLSVLIIVAPITLIYGFIDPTFFHSKVESSINSIGRSAGTWLNPNIAGEALLLGLVMGRNSVPRIIFVIAFCLAGPAVMATGSRAAMIGWLLLSVYCLRSGNLPKLFIAIPVLIAVFYSSVLLFVEDIVESIPEHAAGAENLLARLQFMSGDVDLAEGGGDVRGVIVVNAIQEALERPFLGHGHDYADSFELGSGSHNLLVHLWHMHGALGLLVVVLLAVILYRYSRGSRFLNLSLFAYLWFTLFTHNIFELNQWLVYFAMSLYETTKSERVKIINPTTNRASASKSTRNKTRRRTRSSKNRRFSW